jgi:zinc/manganese transport system substrate-binding protein
MTMKRIALFFALLIAVFATAAVSAPAARLRVVTTLPDYAVLAKAIGGDRISAEAIVRGDQDAHFIRPKPSFVNLVRGADVLVDTGLDLEMWLPAVVDKSGNTRVRSGRPGYVAAAQGMKLLEKPKVMSRVEGGLHIHGNPHVTTSPINLKVAARNIAMGLATNDPAAKATYERHLKALEQEFDNRLFGEKLVQLLGGRTLSDLAEKGRLIPFLETHDFQGKPLIDYLGGWTEQMLPLRGTPIVTYHKNWVYFVRLFGLEEAATVEPKPGIPPSAKHVAELVQLMRDRNVRIVLAANYFDENQVKAVASKVGAIPVIVPLYVGGEPGVYDYFELVDLWVGRLLDAARAAGVAKT